MPNPASHRGLQGLALAGILLGALILRWPGLSLGLPQFCNEDEAHINAGAMRMVANLSLDPGTQKYPALIFDLAAAADLLAILAPQVRAVIHLESFESFRYWIKTQLPPLFRTVLLGRLLCLALGLVSLAMFYRILRLHADPAAALLATLLLAVAPVHQWLSGLLKSDMLLLLWVLLAIHAGYRIGAQGRNRDYALGALALGLALATKFYFLAAAPLLAGAALERSAQSRLAFLREPRLWLMLLAGLLLFALLSPYSLLHWQTTLAWLKLESLNQAGLLPILKRTTGRLWHAPGLFILTSVLPLALGIPLYLLALAGIPDLWRLSRPARYAWVSYGVFFFLLYSLGSTLGLSHYYLTFAAGFCLAGGLRLRRGLASPSRSGRIFWAGALAFVVIYSSVLFNSFIRAETRSLREAREFLLHQIPASAPTAVLIPYRPDPARFPAQIQFYPFYELSPKNLQAVHPEFLVLHQGTFRLAADNPENQDIYYFTYLELEAGRLGYHQVWKKTEHFFQERVYGFLMPDLLNAFSFAAYQRNPPAAAP
jgi:hypothetical protein